LAEKLMMNPMREQIRSLLEVEPRPGGFRAVFNMDKSLMVLPDHFREQPIMPGMCMIQLVLIAGGVARGTKDMRLAVLKNAKFVQPVLPGEQVIIDAEMIGGEDGLVVIKAKLSANDSRRAEINLTAGAGDGAR
jgi:3-hydroxymyristoyl/3-hydroxydecanoyl-(acyl carrier protein) dehydratase